MKLRLIFASAMVMAWVAARGELAETDYSAANPIKIMAVGDSITDDCVAAGAWRRYLQPLLDSNAIPFTFVGRQRSPVAGAFTKVRHEGYCGTVIAPPGVFAAHGYSTANAYLERIVPDALTNNTPDIMLILIGANDLGRGRDPRETAMNDMSHLLDMIFSRVPGVNVILAKPTNLRNAEISVNGVTYGAYASNGPIYSAALQAMVNQRRALGQNVFLSDMFSALDYATMFTGDHLHPNAAGLKAMAQEWFTRIQTILTATNQITASLIHGGDLWFYSDSGADLGTNWSQPGFDDSGWNAGYGRFGWGEATDETIVNTNVTIYFRKEVAGPWNQVFTNLNFRLAQTGGAAVWLNGRELFRTNLPDGPINYATRATKSLTGDAANIYYQTSIAGTNLASGTNVIAVEIHAATNNAAALGFDLELQGGAMAFPPPMLEASRASNNIVLTWPVNNGAGFMLYSATSLGQTGWELVNAAAQTNGSQVYVSLEPSAGTTFFRLQRRQ